MSMKHFYGNEITWSYMKLTTSSLETIVCVLYNNSRTCCSVIWLQFNMLYIDWRGFYRTMSCRSTPDIEETQAHIAPHLACHVHWLLKGHWVCYDGLPLQTERYKKPERKTTCCPQRKEKTERTRSVVGQCLCACVLAVGGHVRCLFM